MTPAETARQERWLTVDEAVVELRVSRRTIYRLLETEKCVSRESERGRELLSSSLPAPRRVAAAASTLPSGVGQDAAYREAGRRWELLQRWSRLTQRERAGAEGDVIRDAWVDAPAELVQRCPSLSQRPHPGSLDRVLRRVQSTFSRGENGALETLGRLGPRKEDREPELPPEARAYVLSLWLQDRARTKARVHRAYLAEAKRRKWPEASYSTIRRVVDSAPRDLEVLARRGEREYQGTAAPFIQRSFDDLAAGEGLNGDHHQFDFFVRCDRSGRLYRPWLTAWLDLRSRALPGWVLCESPSSRTILEAFAHAVRPKPRTEYSRLCGLPSWLYIDNGKDYRSATLEGTTVELGRAGLDDGDVHLLQGLFPQLGLDVTHALPYNAKAKIVERFFGTVAKDFSPCLPGYCGHDHKSKPAEFLREQVAQHKRWLAGEARTTPFLTLAEVSAHWEAWLYSYHLAHHDGLSKGGRKLSPLSCYQLYGQSPVLVTDHALELLLMERATATVQKNGIKIDGLWYSSDAVVCHVGERVQVRRARAEAGRAYVFSLAGKFIGEVIAGEVLRANATLDQVREANQKARQHVQARKRALATLTEGAPADALSLLESLSADVPPAPAAPAADPPDTIRRLSPELDRVPLRQLEPPPERPAVLIHRPQVAAPATPPAPRLRLFASDERFDALESELAAIGGD